MSYTISLVIVLWYSLMAFLFLETLYRSMLIMLGKYYKFLEMNNFMRTCKKCTFSIDKVVFLGFVVSSKDLQVDETKIDAIKTWPTLTNLQQVCSFVGLAGFYRRFVKDFSTIASPIHALSKKNAPSVWVPPQDIAFNELKNFLTHAPLPALPNFDKKLRCNATLVVMA